MNPNENYEDEQVKEFSSLVAACFTLNFIIGTGFLALPWAFYTAGPVLSTIGLGLTCAIASVSGNYLLATMARAECLKYHKFRAFEDTEIGEETYLLKENLQNEEKPLIIGDKKIETPELCQIFLGSWGFNAYAFSILLYIYGVLWSYSSVFCSAMSALLPLTQDSYPIYCMLFAMIVVPMSFMKFSEQVGMQLVLSGCRFLMIFLLVVTPLIAALGGSGNISFDDQKGPIGAPLFDLSGVGKMIPLIVFTAVFHQSIPSLAAEVSEKSQLSYIFGYTFTLCGLSYTLIGIVGAWYFGHNVEQSVNLNWSLYHGAGNYWLSKVISLYVVAFPAIDVISSYPLNAICLASNLVGIVYRDTAIEMENNPRVMYSFMALASIPPIICSLFVRDLGIILSYTGLTGLLTAFCFPAILYISSEIKMKRLGLQVITAYDQIGSSKASAVGMLMFGVASICFCLFDLTKHVHTQ